MEGRTCRWSSATATLIRGASSGPTMEQNVRGTNENKEPAYVMGNHLTLLLVSSWLFPHPPLRRRARQPPETGERGTSFFFFFWEFIFFFRTRTALRDHPDNTGTRTHAAHPHTTHSTPTTTPNQPPKDRRHFRQRGRRKAVILPARKTPSKFRKRHLSRSPTSDEILVDERTWLLLLLLQILHPKAPSTPTTPPAEPSTNLPNHLQQNSSNSQPDGDAAPPSQRTNLQRSEDLRGTKSPSASPLPPAGQGAPPLLDP